MGGSLSTYIRTHAPEYTYRLREGGVARVALEGPLPRMHPPACVERLQRSLMVYSAFLVGVCLRFI